MRKKLSVCLVSLIFLTAGCSGETAAPPPEINDKDIVITAFEKIGKEYLSTSSNADDQRYYQLLSLNEDGDYDRTIQIRLVDGSESQAELLLGSLITAAWSSQKVPRKEALEIRLEEHDYLAGRLQIYYDTEQLLWAVPDLTDRVFFVPLQSDLAAQIDQSPYLGQVLKEKMPFELSDLTALFEKRSTAALLDTPEQMAAAWNDLRFYTSLIDQAREEMIVVPLEGSPEGSTQYMVTVSSGRAGRILATLTHAIDPAQQEFDFLMQLYENLREGKTEITIDENGRLSRIKSIYYADKDQQEYQILIEGTLSQGDQPFESSDLLFSVKEQDKELISFAYERKAEQPQVNWKIKYQSQLAADQSSADFDGTYDLDSGRFDCLFSGVSNQDAYEITAAGSLSGFGGGESGLIQLDTLTIKEDEHWLSLSGSYECQPLEGEIESLEGARFDALAASKEDWTIIIVEIYDKMMRMLESE